MELGNSTVVNLNNAMFYSFKHPINAELQHFLHSKPKGGKLTDKIVDTVWSVEYHLITNEINRRLWNSSWY